MTAPISSNNINSVQFLNARNAFKAATAPKQEEPAEELLQEEIIPENSKSMLDKYNVDEIKKFAQSVGEENLSNDDIKYGLAYGRSVIIDYAV